MLINVVLFWVMCFFSVVGAISLFLAIFFNNENVASRIYEDIENSSEKFFEKFGEILALIFGILAVIPIYLFVNIFWTKKMMLITLGKRELTDLIIMGSLIKKLTTDELVQYHSKLDGIILYYRVKDDLDLMDKIVLNKYFWYKVSENTNPQILERFHERLDWERVIRTRIMTKEILYKYDDYINWNRLVKEHMITEDIFFDYIDKIDITQVNIDKNRWLKKGFRSNRLELYLKLQNIDI